MNKERPLTAEEIELAELWESVETMNHFGTGQFLNDSE
jgi:hypothetical protein